ncbi:DUTPase [Deerpox virus W-848-83]|uniref:Deoxyuridine 5'-triphosphate nucleotidohydrolase n=1 Tax=Deerpox virus (strain Mule deer/United States/W-848-83/1983) TaxID=305674 RepID=Q08FX7_DPV83|nr:dUTPase [Deerpox virus W-848-83]ABI99180.1 DUTPase [Deerpox virus W-848-83]
MSDITVKCLKLSEFATIPKKATYNSAGYDLYSAYDYTVNPFDRILVRTDISLEIPECCYGRIAPRSGLALNYNIDIGGGVIDRDYRGNIGVIVINNSTCVFEIKTGDRIAQIIFERIENPSIEEVLELKDTFRGNRGFGSSGLN